ncbi:MAG: hypothetical protein M1835_006299 [Candelina submexicana]|nr:MAG: hypothetical protein M1835_006299 [Candelina submexicana]
MSLWQSYRALAPRTRLFFGLGVMAWAGVGILMTDQVEKTFGMVPTEQDKHRLEEVLPKVTFVEKDGSDEVRS